MLDNANSRERAASIVEPIARFLLRIGLTANVVTVTTALTTSVAILATWPRGSFFLGLCLGTPFVVGDLIDGTMAKLSGETNPFGGFLDSVMDRVTDGAIFGSLAFYFLVHEATWLGATAIALLVATEIVPYARAKAESLGVQAKVGLMERSDRLAVLALAVIADYVGFGLALPSAIVLMAIATWFTVLQRMHAAFRGLGNVA